MTALSMAEYIWMDGAIPTRFVRSKTRVIRIPKAPKLSDFPVWSFDGSSTNQAEGDASDCLIQPVMFVPDPIRGGDNYLVMCEVQNADGTDHPSNSRAQLRAVLDAGAAKQDPWMGFEQEYTMFENNTPLGWPDKGFPAPQGPYYCGVGADECFGRDLVEDHAALCIEAGILFYGINAEVMPGQWEFQIGYRGDKSETSDALTMCDHMWLARWLLYRVGEDHNICLTLSNKPIAGDWNGAGMHTNFSTKDLRSKTKGKKAIDDAIKALEEKHDKHIKLYGHELHHRLTGDHETCDIETFKSGVSDRGASIRIPPTVAQDGYGYLEDRRPGANSDPYLVAARICATICDVDESVMTFTQWPRKK